MKAKFFSKKILYRSEVGGKKKNIVHDTTTIPPWVQTIVRKEAHGARKQAIGGYNSVNISVST